MKMFMEMGGKKQIQKNLQDFGVSCRFMHIYTKIRTLLPTGISFPKEMVYFSLMHRLSFQLVIRKMYLLKILQIESLIFIQIKRK